MFFFMSFFFQILFHPIIYFFSLLDDANTHIFTLNILEDLDDLGTQFTSIHDMIQHVTNYYRKCALTGHSDETRGLD